jgi:hypothetical protein
MTGTPNPITPPAELIHQWVHRDPGDDGFLERLANKAAQWGADRELEACCALLDDFNTHHLIEPLRSRRRPQPLSLKAQALKELSDIYNDDKMDDHAYDTLRRALKQLSDD